MRRYAVMLAISLAFAGACKETLLLPSDTKPDAGTGGSGSGGFASGGFPGGTGGRSSGSGGGSGGKPGGTGGSGMPSACASGQRKMMVQFDIKRAQVVLAVGRNNSMQTPYANGTPRMVAVQQVIHTVVEKNDSAIFFAYEDFPSNMPCSNGTSCCTSPNPVYPAPDRSFSIDSAMSDYCFPNPPGPGCYSMSSGRPIADALRKVIGSNGQDPILKPDDQQIERHVILLVDGGPQCSSEDPQTSCNNAKSQLAQLTIAGVHVHIVPIADDFEPPSDCLKAMATQSDSGATSNQPFGFRARDAGELMSSLSKIIDDAAQAACTITLFQGLNDMRSISVEISGATVLPFDSSGRALWSLEPNGTIELYGQACRDVQNANNTAVKVWQCQ